MAFGKVIMIITRTINIVFQAVWSFFRSPNSFIFPPVTKTQMMTDVTIITFMLINVSVSRSFYHPLSG